MHDPSRDSGGLTKPRLGRGRSSAGASMWAFVLLWGAAIATELQQQASGKGAADVLIPDVGSALLEAGADNAIYVARPYNDPGPLRQAPRIDDSVLVSQPDNKLQWRHRLVIQQQALPSLKVVGPVVEEQTNKSHGTIYNNVTRSAPNAPGGIPAAPKGRPGKIVRMSPSQLFNDSGEYRVSRRDRVRKAAGFEIAYDYYFKPDEQHTPNFKSMTKKSMPLILATSFLIILIICIAVCISGICWERTRRLVAPSAPPETPTVTEMSHRNAAGDSNDSNAYANDKYMI
ncbi:uncharacterized protein LOC135370401 [Ornithodoros turicata]|uniref:uncharacterized protein LOC135370401 n=1 Tax=Ornithodoros turicata TaxID=34597 RepID=UPI003139F238